MQPSRPKAHVGCTTQPARSGSLFVPPKRTLCPPRLVPPDDSRPVWLPVWRAATHTIIWPTFSVGLQQFPMSSSSLSSLVLSRQLNFQSIPSPTFSPEFCLHLQPRARPCLASHSHPCSQTPPYARLIHSTVESLIGSLSQELSRLDCLA